jgi:hypothetical protein
MSLKRKLAAGNDEEAAKVHFQTEIKTVLGLLAIQSTGHTAGQG